MTSANRINRLFRAVASTAVTAAALAGCADIRATRSLELYVERDFVTSLEQSRLALAEDKNNKFALAMAGWSSFQMGRHQDAQSYFRNILHHDPKNFDGLLGMGWTQFKLGRIEVARQYFEQARQNIELPWQQRFVWDALGWVALKKGNRDKARTRFLNELKTIEHRPYTADAHVGLGWTALDEKKYADARKSFHTGLRANSGCFNCYDGLARVELKKGNYEGALKYTLSGIHRVRHSIHLITLLAAVLDRIDDPKRSLRTYQKLIARYPRAAFFHVGLAAAYVDLSRLSDAERSLARALKLDPGYPGLRQKLRKMKRAGASGMGISSLVDERGLLSSYRPLPAQAAFNVGRGPVGPSLFPAAGTGIEHAGANAPSLNRRPKLALTKAVYRFDAHMRAILFENAIVSDQQPAPLGALLVSVSIYNKGWALLDAGRMDDAERAFETAALTMPVHLRYLMRDALGWVAFYRRDYKEAGAIFGKVLAERPDSYLSRKGLGFVHLAKGRFSEGAKLIEESLLQNPYQVPVSYVAPGEQLIGAGRYAEAKRILEIGAWAHPRVSKISLLLARSLAGLGQIDGAVEHVEAAAGTNPVEVEAAFDGMKLPVRKALPAIRALAWGLLLAGDYKGARRRFDQLLSIAGKNPEAMRGRGFALFRLGKYKEAIADLSAATRHEPDSLPAISQELPIPGTGKRAQVTYNAGSVLAWTYLRLGNAAQAELEFRKTLKEHPSWLDALCGLGYSLLAQNDPNGAMRSFQAALKISPIYPDARSGMNAAKAALGGQNAAVGAPLPAVKFK